MDRRRAPGVPVSRETTRTLDSPPRPPQFTTATDYDESLYQGDVVSGGAGDEYSAARMRKAATAGADPPGTPAPSANAAGSSVGGVPPVGPSGSKFRVLSADEAAVLDRYWSLRGVQAAEKRIALARLGDAALSDEQDGVGPTGGFLDLCGVRGAPSSQLVPELSQAVMLWEEQGDLVSSERLREVSRRSLALHALLGGEGGDVAMMVFREPRVLDVDPSAVVERLLEMRVAAGGEDVVKAIQDQPSLLLSDIRVDPREGQAQRSAAWAGGITTDNDPEWEARFQELVAYKEAHGDPHCGFRDGDDRQLFRWTRVQRRAFGDGRLGEARQVALAQLGFRFDEAEAEWMRWFAELKKCQVETGVAYPNPLVSAGHGAGPGGIPGGGCRGAHGPRPDPRPRPPLSQGDNTNYYLINWCGIQRVAMRCDRLSQEQIGLLESLGFDWTGADPLS